MSWRVLWCDEVRKEVEREEDQEERSLELLTIVYLFDTAASSSSDKLFHTEHTDLLKAESVSVCLCVCVVCVYGWGVSSAKGHPKEVPIKASGSNWYFYLHIRRQEIFLIFLNGHFLFLNSYLQKIYQEDIVYIVETLLVVGCMNKCVNNKCPHSQHVNKLCKNAVLWS